MNIQPSRTPGLPGHPFRGLALAAALAAILAPLAACGPKARVNESTLPVDADGVMIASRPDLPERGVGVASLAVFPQVDTPLAVTQTQPEDGADGVAGGKDEARIVVQFNHPVVPLVSVDDQAGLPAAATVTPAIAGKGEWLNTSTWILTPDGDLPPATRFTVSVDADLTDILGGKLAEPVRFSFVTAAPAVVRTYPEDGSVDAGATQPITVTFSQAMDRASAEGAFRVHPADRPGETVPGTFRWSGNDMGFLPGRALARGAAHVATVAAGARAATGEAGLAADHAWRFTTAPLPVLVRTTPADGTQKSPHLRHESLKLVFNTPMRTDGVTVTVQPTITNLSVYAYDGREASVNGGWLASTAYTVTVKAESESRFGDALGEDRVIRFTTAEIEPSLWLKSTGRFSVYDAARPPLAFVDAINVEAADVAVYNVDRAAFLRMTTTSDRWSAWDSYRPAEGNLVRRWAASTQAPLDTARRISVTLGAGAGGAIEPGLYYVRVTSDAAADRDNRMIFLATAVNLTIKHSWDEVLVWATDLRTGKPVAGLPIDLYDQDTEPLASGRTDRDGVYRAAVSEKDGDAALVAVSESGGRIVAAASAEWTEGIDPWAFNLPYSGYRQPRYAALYTDRPIYRTGQTIYYRGVVRDDDDAVYALPNVDEVFVTVRDPNYEEVLKTTLRVGDFGTVAGEIPLAPGARLGAYTIDMAVRRDDDPEAYDSIASVSFTVAAYRKPEFQVTVSTDQPDYANGETVKVTADAAYFFGGPVAGAAVQWRLLTDDYFFNPPDVEGWWDWIDYDLTEQRYYDAQGEVVREGEGTLDADGKLTFEIPADLGEAPLSQVFTIDVEITDINHQAVAGRTSAVVHKGNVYVGLRPARYVSGRGEPAAFDVLAVDPDGRPVPGQSVDLAFQQRTWYSVKEKRENGEFYWTSAYTDTLVSEATVTTDDDGAATASFTPAEGGVHRLVAVARDAAGNEVRSATYAWITSGRFVNWRQENNDRIALVADKKLYAVGDVAKVLVPAPFAGAEALVTVERGKLRDVRRVALPGNSETLEIPIRPDYTPNVYVSVVLVKGVGPDSPLPQLKVGYTNLQVSTDTKILDIAIRPDRDEPYRPRDTVRYAVDVTDHTGKPVRAELSAALVDKAILSLAPDPSTSLVNAFYGQRMLGVGTGASLTEFADRLNQELAAEKKGGGGGPADAEGTVRRLFRDTAFWSPSVVTGADGKASLEVELPDNLTTWNLNLRGVTGADTLVGTGVNEIVSTRPVLVRPVVPRFFVVGDAAQIETVVNNASGAAVDVAVSLAATGLGIADPAPQDLSIPDGGRAKVVWQVEVPATGLNPPTVPDAFGSVTVQMGATGGGHTDSVELQIPVYQFSEPQVVATAGEVGTGETRVTERIQLPERVDTSQGDLSVRLAPSLAAASIATLEWLEPHPQECPGGAVSRLVPNVATLLALQKLDVAGDRRVALKAALDADVPETLQKLYAWQNNDGGWAWCGADRSNAWITAYALLGLQLARDAGFELGDETRARAADFLQQELNRAVDVEEGWDLDQRAFIVWVLARQDDVPASRAVTLYERRAGLKLYARAFLALALAEIDAAGQKSRIDTLLADLGGKAVVSATGTAWEEDEPSHRDMSTDLRTSAIVVMALSQLDPGNPSLVNGVRWLMAQRVEDHWATRQEDAWAVLALTAYMQATGELEGRYAYHVELNAAELGKGEVDARNIDVPVTLRAPVADMKVGGANDLVLRRDGPGVLYYATHLRLWQPVDALEPVARGIVLGRQYFAVDRKTFKATGDAVDTANIGDIVQVKLTLIAESPLHYVKVEDPIPAGFEIVDTSLQTTSAAATGPRMEEVADDGADAEDRPWWARWWWSYWVDSQLLDHKAVLYASHLEPGTYEYTYLLRASTAGNYHAIPAMAEQESFPEVFGRSAGGVFTIEGE